MKSQKFIITNVFIFAFTFVYCFSQAGGAALPILEVSTDARYDGMGCTGTAIANDVFATVRNPAGLGFVKNSNITNGFKNYLSDSTEIFYEGAFSFSHFPQNSNINMPYNKDNSHYNITTGIYLKSLKGMFAVDYSYFKSGEVTKYDAFGNYNIEEFYVGLAYGTKIGADWGLGVKAKYMNFNLSPAGLLPENKGSGYAFDLGVIWNPELGTDSNSILNKRGLSLGISLQNLGPSVDYERKNQVLPTILKIGAGLNFKINPENSIIFAIDAAKLLIRMDNNSTDQLPESLITSWERPFDATLGFGAEYWYIHYFALRAGYFTEPQNLGNRQFMTLGASLSYLYFQADISYHYTSNDVSGLINKTKFTFRVVIK